jgi:uncharacterized protein (TIGR00251 family)
MALSHIALQVIPRSSCNEIVGWLKDVQGLPVLKVKINAPPEDGKANKALIHFLAKEWGVSKQYLKLTSGETSRHKRLNIHSQLLYSQLQQEAEIQLSKICD